MQALSGAWFKLADTKGNYLGVLMVPGPIADDLAKKDSARFYRRPKIEFGSFNNAANLSIQEFAISRARHGDDPVLLWGITPEEISTEPGFAFLPSAEYLRRPAPEPKADERRPVQSGKHLAAARDVSA